MSILSEQKIRNLIKSLLTEGFKEDQDFLKEKYPKLSQKLSAFNPKQIRWLIMRFGEKTQIQEIHPIEDCIPTLEAYTSQETQTSIKSKYNQNIEFRQAVDKEFPPDQRKWSNPADIDYITIDEMIELRTLASRKKQNIKIQNNLDNSSTVVGKAGPWTVYMPETVEDSCNIVGVNADTQKPNTTWCTARIEGENLFYAYMTQGVILFYVIRDNPKTPNDYISLGYVDGQLTHDGIDGGVTVNGKNVGLKRDQLHDIFGQYFEQIINITNSKVKPLDGIHPSAKLLKSAFYDMDSFNKLFSGLSQSNKSMLLRAMLTSRGEKDKEYIDKTTPEIADKMSDIFMRMVVQGQNTWAISCIDIMPNVLVTSLCHKIVALYHEGNSSNQKDAHKVFKVMCDWWPRHITEHHMIMIIESDSSELINTLVQRMPKNIPNRVAEYIVTNEKFGDNITVLRDLITQDNKPTSSIVLKILRICDEYNRDSWKSRIIGDLLGKSIRLSDGMSDELAQYMLQHIKNSNDQSDKLYSYYILQWLIQNTVITDNNKLNIYRQQQQKLSTENINTVLSLIENSRHGQQLNNITNRAIFDSLHWYTADKKLKSRTARNESRQIQKISERHLRQIIRNIYVNLTSSTPTFPLRVYYYHTMYVP